MIPISRSTCEPCLPKAWNALSPEETESVLKEYIHEDGRKRHILRDFFTSSFPDYCRDHRVPEYKLKVMNSLISCKTGKLGYSLIHCDTCGRTEMRACACGNRNCPSCGYLNEKKWTALRQSEVIPGIPYFHLVFTLPHDLSTIMYQNQRTILNLLFRSAADTVLTLTYGPDTDTGQAQDDAVPSDGPSHLWVRPLPALSCSHAGVRRRADEGHEGIQKVPVEFFFPSGQGPAQCL